MAVLAIFDVRGDTAQLLSRYERALPRIAEVSPGPPRLHVCAGTAEGIRIVDVWDTEEQLQRFGSNPAFHDVLREFGLPEPQVQAFPVHRMGW